MTGPAAHSPFGGSVAERFIHCPATIERSKGFPDQEDTEFTVEGTKLHEVAERALTDFSYEYPDWMDDEQISVVETYTNHVANRLAHHDHLKRKPKLKVETRVSMPDLHPDFYGTADVIIHADTVLEVIDLKAGRGVAVDIEYNGRVNKQLGYYALGALRTLTAEEQDKIETVICTIVQPRLGGIKHKVTDFSDLHDLAKELVAGAKAAVQPNPPAKAGKWCRFCTAKPTCKEHIADIMERAKLDFAPDTSKPSVKDISELLDDAAMIESWIHSVRAHAKWMVEFNGDTIPGWQVLPTRPIRKWIDEDKTAQHIFTNTDVAEDDIRPRKLLSPSQMEKLFKNAGIVLDINGLVLRESGGSKIVKDTEDANSANTLDFE